MGWVGESVCANADAAVCAFGFRRQLGQISPTCVREPCASSLTHVRTHAPWQATRDPVAFCEEGNDRVQLQQRAQVMTLGESPRRHHSGLYYFSNCSGRERGVCVHSPAFLQPLLRSGIVSGRGPHSVDSLCTHTHHTHACSAHAHTHTHPYTRHTHTHTHAHTHKRTRKYARTHETDTHTEASAHTPAHASKQMPHAPASEAPACLCRR